MGIFVCDNNLQLYTCISFNISAVSLTCENSFITVASVRHFTMKGELLLKVCGHRVVGYSRIYYLILFQAPGEFSDYNKRVKT